MAVGEVLSALQMLTEGRRRKNATSWGMGLGQGLASIGDSFAEKADREQRAAEAERNRQFQLDLLTKRDEMEQAREREKGISEELRGIETTNAFNEMYPGLNLKPGLDPVAMRAAADDFRRAQAEQDDRERIARAYGLLGDTPTNNKPPVDPSEYDTKLSAEDESEFQKWKAVNAPDDSGYDYDLRGAFKAGLRPGEDGHWPDTFKKPNHPTFSNQSVYATGDNLNRAGSWNDDGSFVAPTQSTHLLEPGRLPPADEIARIAGKVSETRAAMSLYESMLPFAQTSVDVASRLPFPGIPAPPPLPKIVPASEFLAMNGGVLSPKTVMDYMAGVRQAADQLRMLSQEARLSQPDPVKPEKTLEQIEAEAAARARGTSAGQAMGQPKPYSPTFEDRSRFDALENEVRDSETRLQDMQRARESNRFSTLAITDEMVKEARLDIIYRRVRVNAQYAAQGLQPKYPDAVIENLPFEVRRYIEQRANGER